MTINIGGNDKTSGEKTADYSLDEFVTALKSGLSLSPSEDVAFDADARALPMYEKISKMLQSKGINTLEVRRHASQQPQQEELQKPMVPQAQPEIQEQQARHVAPPLQENEFSLINSAVEKEAPAPQPSPIVEDAVDVNVPSDLEAMLSSVSNQLQNEPAKNYDSEDENSAIVYTFGSSKGGSGKTFTCIASARRYAQLYPEKKIALIDLDITDAQVGISLHYISPNVNNAYLSWLSENENLDLTTSFRETVLGNNLHVFAGNSSGLARDRYPDDFWIDFLTKVVHSYDTVFIDTGIDYLNLEPIRMAYEIADRVVVLSGTSIKSITSIKKQLSFLAGVSDGSPYTQEMDIIGKVGIVFTQWDPGNPVEQVPSLLQNMARVGDISVPILVKFGYIKYIQEIEFLGNWDLADDKKFQAGFDKILD